MLTANVAGAVEVWMQTTGAFWNGGPEVTTTVGDQTINWNDWVARLGSTKAVAVEGIDLAVADADVFYAWHNGENPMGVRSVLKLKASSWMPWLCTKAARINAAFGAGTNLNGIDVDGTVALDADQHYAFKVNGSMSPMEDVTVTAGYRQMQDGFAPMYAREGRRQHRSVPQGQP